MKTRHAQLNTKPLSGAQGSGTHKTDNTIEVTILERNFVGDSELICWMTLSRKRDMSYETGHGIFAHHDERQFDSNSSLQYRYKAIGSDVSNFVAHTHPNT